MNHLTLIRAKTIVSHAENEFCNGVDIPDAFAPFARGGATTRTEAINALMIVIADFYRSASRQGQSAMREFEQYAHGSGSIAMRIIADAAESPVALEAIIRSSDQESIGSYVEFLKTIDPGKPGFMNRVYERIGVNASAGDKGFSEVTTAPTKRPWWRSLLAILVCGSLALGYFVGGSVIFGWKNGGGFIPMLIAGTVILTLWGVIRGGTSEDK